MNTALIILLIMTILGIAFGFLLAYANKKFKTEVNPLIHIVEDILPKGQCGACGYPGCLAYAEAVVLDPKVPANLCIPGKDMVAKEVAKLTGKQATAIEPKIAKIHCAGTPAVAQNKYLYQGIKDCAAANSLFNGAKACQFGCLGLGSCIQACPFEALSLGANHLPVVDAHKCTACGKCQEACPKQLISLVPLTAKVHVACHSLGKGASAKKDCSAACIGCTICAKTCPLQAITMHNNLPEVQHEICQTCTNAVCLTKCPTKALQAFLV